MSSNARHNEANGEGNRDGIDNNLSWNLRRRGPTGDPAVDALRVRLIKNAVTLLMLSRGVPMLLFGDEIRRTQGGNNNAHNQDNATSWLDWTMVERHRDILRYFRQMMAFRKAHPSLSRPYFYSGEINERGLPDISWHGTILNSPGFDDPDARALACTIAGFRDAADLHVMMNMFWEPLTFEVPASPQRTWRLAIDTFADSPDDIASAGEELSVDQSACTVQARSIVVLLSAERRAGLPA